MNSQSFKPLSYNVSACKVRHETQRVECLKIFAEFHSLLGRYTEGRYLFAKVNPIGNLPDDVTPRYLYRLIMAMLIAMTCEATETWAEIEEQAGRLRSSDRPDLDHAMEFLGMEFQERHQLNNLLDTLEKLSYSVN